MLQIKGKNTEELCKAYLLPNVKINLTPKLVNKTCWLGIWETGICVAMGKARKTSPTHSSFPIVSKKPEKPSYLLSMPMCLQRAIRLLVHLPLQCLGNGFDPISSAITGIYYHGDLHLRMNLENSSGPVFIVLFWQYLLLWKKARISLPVKAVLHIWKKYRKGESGKERWKIKKKKKASCYFQIYQEKIDIDWKKLFPIHKDCMTPSTSHKQVTTVPISSILYGVLLCRI